MSLLNEPYHLNFNSTFHLLAQDYIYSQNLTGLSNTRNLKTLQVMCSFEGNLMISLCKELEALAGNEVLQRLRVKC